MIWLSPWALWSERSPVGSVLRMSPGCLSGAIGNVDIVRSINCRLNGALSLLLSGSTPDPREGTGGTRYP